MEYKSKVVKKRRDQQNRNRKARGLIKIKIRGRKRWVSPTKED